MKATYLACCCTKELAMSRICVGNKVKLTWAKLPKMRFYAVALHLHIEFEITSARYNWFWSIALQQLVPGHITVLLAEDNCRLILIRSLLRRNPIKISSTVLRRNLLSFLCLSPIPPIFLSLYPRQYFHRPYSVGVIIP